LQSFLRAIAKCFARLSHGLDLCLSITLLHCIKTMQARIMKCSLWGATKTPDIVPKLRAFGWEGFPRTRASNRGTP